MYTFLFGAALALAPSAAAAEPASLATVIDGDTIDINVGGVAERVRFSGIDAPETGTCEAAAATARMTELLGAGDLVIVAGDPDEDRDRYDRILRYVHVAVDPGVDNDGTADGMLDVGAALIAEGYAIARYDSRDGYGPHVREATYVALDAASAPFACTAEQLATFDPEADDSVTTTTEDPFDDEAWVAQVAESDGGAVFYQNCDAVRAAGADPIRRGDPGWDSKFDRDDDGVGCE